MALVGQQGTHASLMHADTCCVADMSKRTVWFAVVAVSADFWLALALIVRVVAR